MKATLRANIFFLTIFRKLFTIFRMLLPTVAR